MGSDTVEYRGHNFLSRTWSFPIQSKLTTTELAETTQAVRALLMSQAQSAEQAIYREPFKSDMKATHTLQPAASIPLKCTSKKQQRQG